ncbi:MAG: hypothetical protein JW709_08000, partial [Sedimentisphaerales bacterium]|nr:hypothetical protein [Sedimentisphaerales bacterium]
TWIRHYPHFATPRELEVPGGEGDHGGGDKRMLDDIFGEGGQDSLGRAADYIQGAYSILVGAAANESIRTGRVIALTDMVTDLPDLTFPSIPSFGATINYIPNTCRVTS